MFAKNDYYIIVAHMEQDPLEHSRIVAYNVLNQFNKRFIKLILHEHPEDDDPMIWIIPNEESTQIDLDLAREFIDDRAELFKFLDEISLDPSLN